MACDSKQNNYGMQINVICNHTIQEKGYNLVSYNNENKCNPIVNFEYSCKKPTFDRVNSLWYWIERYWFI